LAGADTQERLSYAAALLDQLAALVAEAGAAGPALLCRLAASETRAAAGLPAKDQTDAA
jgi:hypothetical protein